MKYLRASSGVAGTALIVCTCLMIFLPQGVVIGILLQVGDVLVEGFLWTAGLRLHWKQRNEHRSRHDGAI